MKSFKSAPLLVLSAWLIGSTSLYSNVYASCTNCGENKNVVKRNIFTNARPRINTTRSNIFANRTIQRDDSKASSSSGPIFGTNDCTQSFKPIFGDNNCTRKKCGGAMFGPQSCKRIELPCDNCNTVQPQTPKNAYIKNYKTIPSDNVFDKIHKCSDLAPIQLEWVDFRIHNENSESYSRNLGKYRFRLFGCRRNSKNAILDEGRIIQKNMRFIDIFEETVEDCYKIKKIPYDLCLNDQDYEAPEYILTAEITDYFMNVCDEYDWDKSSSADKRTGSAEMTVTWRLMDLTKSKILWKGQTTGYSELSEGEYNGEIILIERAFADASSNLKGMPDFEQQLSTRITPEVLEEQKTTLLALEQAANPVKCKIPTTKAQTCPIENKGGTTSMGGYNQDNQCPMPAEIIEYKYDDTYSHITTEAIPLEQDTQLYNTDSTSICYQDSEISKIYSQDNDCYAPIDNYIYPIDNACENPNFNSQNEECDPSLVGFVKADIECVQNNLEKAILDQENTSPRICLFANDVTSSGGISKDTGYIVPETEIIQTSKTIKQGPEWKPFVEESIQADNIPEKPACIENISPYTEMNPENLYKVRSSMLAISNDEGKQAAGLQISSNQILTSAEVVDENTSIYKIKTINGTIENAKLVSVNIQKNTALLRTENNMYFQPLSLNLQLPNVGDDGYMSLGLLKKSSTDNYLDDKGSIKGYRFSDSKGTQIITDTFVQTVSAGGLLIDENGTITGFASNTQQYDNNGDLFSPILDAINSVGLEVCGQTEPFAKAPTAIIKPVSSAIDNFKGSKAPKVMSKGKRK